LFTSNLSEDHTAVSGFSGNTSRATHRGDFNCVVRAQNGRLIHLVDPSAALVIPDSHYKPYQHPSKDTKFKRPHPSKFQSISNKQPWKKQANFANPKNWARGGKTSDHGARGNYNGKSEFFDPDYHKRFQANHVIGQQQQPSAIIPPPYMY